MIGLEFVASSQNAFEQDGGNDTRKAFGHFQLAQFARLCSLDTKAYNPARFSSKRIWLDLWRDCGARQLRLRYH